jgi:hypothetical protein
MTSSGFDRSGLGALALALAAFAAAACCGPAAVAVSVSSSGSGGGTACDPQPALDSFWAQTATTTGVPMPATMCKYRGDVVLVANVAEL